MANWKLIGGITAGVLVIGGLGSACDDNSTNTGSTTATTDTPATATAKTDDTASSKTEMKPIPSFVGMGLQSAQDTAQAAGFFSLASHDSLGRDRMQALDRNWKVCSQNVMAGKTVSTDTKLDFGAVKLDETCPATDEKAPEAAGSTMPDFGGKSVKAARAALDSGISITVTDVSGDDRFILVESNWKVCTQTPKAGTKLNGQPVEFGAVKFEETCP
ncbi:PASTA domain-containing protein [Streptomyces sp. NBC_00377]|uniref:PASTA domain-containing protein n=1 Tax=unclassified Streptomyces TaxID=2593676 RepID=UPI002E1A5B89|nr:MULTISPECIES: PASTA domain-containing protein [unclassified Streptomyces]